MIHLKKSDFDTLRKKWDEKDKKWYFSIIDIVSLTKKSTDSRNYWKVLKNRLKTIDNQLVTKCNQLKLQASDSKFYLTDVGDIDTITEILKLISRDNVLHFKAWAMSLTAPKNTEMTALLNRKKVINEISPKNKKLSYPQVTYNLAKLLNKNIDTQTEQIEEKIPKKTFKKISKMRTI